MDRLNFNHLYYFYLVAKEGSIKAVSEKIHISQPTVSDQIKLLEEYFDCKLFDRKHRSLFLTEQGKLALEYAQELFDKSKELTVLMRSKKNQMRQSIDIGLTHYMSHYLNYDHLLPLFVPSNIKVNFHESPRVELLGKLEEGILDMVISNSKESLSTTMISYKIGRNRTYALANKSYSKYKRKFPEALQSLPYFSYASESTMRFEVELFFAKYGITPKIIGEANDTGLIELIINNQLGFTIVPETIKKKLSSHQDVIVLGELKELQSEVFGIVKKGVNNNILELLQSLSG